MARNALDLALMLQMVAGPSPLAPLQQPVAGRDFVGAVQRGPPNNLRLAYCPDIVGIGVDPAVESVCRGAVDRLTSSGATVDLIELDLSAGRDAFLALRGHWFASWMSERLDHLAGFGINVRSNTRAGIEAVGMDLGKAETIRGRIWHRMRELFERYDHLLTPTMAVAPFPVEQNYPETVAGRTMSTYVDWLAPTFVLSLTGLPVASVPAGLDGDGLPVGLQIVGRPLGEEAVLALAALVQRDNPIGSPAG